MLIAPIFAALGYWQLQRAAEKEAILDRIDVAEQAAPLTLAEQSPAALHLATVAVTCTYLQDKQFLLDNRVYEQRVGFEVLLPCVLENGTAVLLNRGWIAGGSSRSTLPDVSIKGGLDTPLTGTFSVPGEGFTLGEALGGNDSDWPRLVQYYDFDAISDALGITLIKGVLYLQPENPLGLTYTWRPIAFGPEKHYGYALQWFSLLATLIVLYIVLNLRRVESGTSSE